MQEIMLDAIERPRKPGRFRECGFVPGVLYGDDTPADSLVKFDEKALRQVISHHGSRANIIINLNGNKKAGFIKEVQRKPITGDLVHIDVQIVSKEHEIKRQITIEFNGEDALEKNHLQLNKLKSDITVFGKLALMPETIHVDVSEMELKDSITYTDFNLDAQLKTEDTDTIFGVIIEKKMPHIDKTDVSDSDLII